MTKLETPTFIPEFFELPKFAHEQILGDSFHEIKEWLKNEQHCYLEKNTPLENYKCKNYKCKESEDIKGFDVPVLIKSRNGQNKGLMIIVGESPLRNGTENGLLVGFPFAVDYKNEPPQCAVYKKLFNELLKDYDLYITDIIKVWSKSKSKNLKVTKDDNDVLNLELGTLSNMYDNKIHILLMGNNAQKWKIKYEESLIRKITEIKIPHMSQQNWHTWRIKKYEDTFRRLIKENKITEEDIEDLLVKDTNELEFCSMKADTVANTAFEMISSELEKKIK